MKEVGREREARIREACVRNLDVSANNARSMMARLIAGEASSAESRQLPASEGPHLYHVAYSRVGRGEHTG